MKWDITSDEKLKILIALGKNRKEIGKELNTSQSSIKNRTFRLGIKSIKEHHETIKCRNCGEIINKTISDEKLFCNSSCSAQYNNRNRKHSDETKGKIRNKVNTYHQNKFIENLKIFNNNPENFSPKELRNETKSIEHKFKVEFINRMVKQEPRKCKSCGKSKIMKKRVTLCDDCHKDYYKFYRPQCEFSFNFNDYKSEFNLDILKEYGWYSPSNKGNNLNGVSKDHIYSCKDGFLNGIDPNIIKHPANCELMKHCDNNRKKTQSNITIDELLIKIKIWNENIKYLGSVAD